MSFRWASRCLLAGCLMVSVATPAVAIDGVIEINQELAVFGRLPGDAPDFPVTITMPGSYRLSGNLVVSDINAVGIDVLAADVTIDLNGFIVQGPGRDIGTGNSIGIRSVSANVRVVNGTVREFGGHGISLGDVSAAERISAIRNGGQGISVSNTSLVSKCLAVENHDAGIAVGSRSVVGASRAENNGSDGIRSGSSSVVHDCQALGNGSDGVEAGLGNVVAQCTSTQNTDDGVFLTSGVVTRTQASVNDGDGIQAPNTSAVTENSTSYNDGYGLNLGNAAGYSDNAIVTLFGALGTVQGGLATGGNLCNASVVCP